MAVHAESPDGNWDGQCKQNCSRLGRARNQSEGEERLHFGFKYAPATGRQRSAISGNPEGKYPVERCTYSEAYKDEADDDQYCAGRNFVLEEPFSESDEEKQHDVEVIDKKDKKSLKPRKHFLSLPIAKQRIRTLSGTIPPIGYSPVWGGPTMCLKCLEFFDIPKETESYARHLIDRHKIVIADIGLIADLKKYIEHWRHRFGETDIIKYFPLFIPTEMDELFGKVDSYYLLSPKVPEDRQLREQLAVSRLEEVIACQQRERSDNTFCRRCLFCDYVVRGNRAKYIHHLYLIHRLNLGSPDNLVFVSEYIDILSEKIKRGECLKCEAVLPSHKELMEHMRGLGHREVNPDNLLYDKFYVINYLELGKKWHEVLAEDFEDSMQAFADSDEESQGDTWVDWVEDDMENASNLVCLFCNKAFSQLAPMLEHHKADHQYDMFNFFEKENLNFYQRVKFVNYIRKMVYERKCFICSKADMESQEAFRQHFSDMGKEHMQETPPRELWDKDEYFMPTYENDHLLTQLDNVDLENAADKALDIKETLEEAAVSIAEPDSVCSENVPVVTDSILSDEFVLNELH
uniref:C2H2-type domain-containing protein n=1 Tax=Trichuris muris TaxID=70415 RepID=A0A5S6R1Z8_TRIMR